MNLLVGFCNRFSFSLGKESRIEVDIEEDIKNLGGL